jgi:exodeoxyribonuclease VII small subunit
MEQKSETSFEQNLERLEELVNKLEQGDLPLEDAIKLFKEGVRLSRACSEKLAAVEVEVRELVTATEKPEAENGG